MNLTIGNAAYRLVCEERSGYWTAHAVHVDTNERFGIEATAQTAEEAEARLRRWLEWQHEHSEALKVLQEAERAYHRAMAGAAFASQTDGEADAGSRSALSLVDAARARLDELRARRPPM